MIAVRRYVICFGIAVCVILLLQSYHRRGVHPVLRPKEPAQLPLDPSDGRFHWEEVPVRNPVTSVKPLPTEKPDRLPKVQFEFREETQDHRTARLHRLEVVKGTFEHCWASYKKHAWLHDEIAPISGGYRDVFGGWAASLVDNLDNLWIMGLKSEFEEAVKAVAEIDLSKVTLETINVFETTIRHLGGLLAAYDLSRDRRLLDKALEFGHMLLVSFDTPNHLPITRWNPVQGVRGNQEAGSVVLVAEIGSLSMEFTRLSQITGDPRWYDATDRITRLFHDQQDKTYLPGMWPVTVDAKLANFTKDTFFTLSAMSDSLYEYFPKMHALLGGVDPIFQKLYDGGMATAIKYNLFRPLTPDNADILISGNVRSYEGSAPILDPQGQHLVCFAGGMFALGGKLFKKPEHLQIGKKLTDGCIWAYKNMPLGIMPEVFSMLPCASLSTSDCQWDEKLWKQAIHRSKTESLSVEELIANRRLPPGFTDIHDRRYILRPEAIESLFLLYRITGEHYLQEEAWHMFSAIMNASRTDLANAALADISYTREQLEQEDISIQMDSMESFWMAETLKYFYLIFSEPDIISLDKWVFNTEAHAFLRATPD